MAIAIDRMVRRMGRTRFALVTCLAWALPAAAWAGSVDLYPGPAPWIALGVSGALLVGWLLLVRRAASVPVEPRASRLDLRSMSAAERGWNLAFAVCALGVIGWLNGAATVDWSPLGRALAAGRPGALALTGGLVALLLGFAAGAVLSWRRAAAAFRRR